MPRVVEINEIGEFLELQPKWNNLLKRSRNNHIFLTWECISNCIKYFANNVELKILYVEDNDKILAIAPLRMAHYNFLNSFNYGVIEPAGYRFFDYTDLILIERNAECLKLFLQYLLKQDSWDFIYLFDIPGNSPTQQLLPEVAKVLCITCEVEPGVICPYMSLPDSMGSYMSGLGRNLRRNLRRYMRKLETDYGRVDFKRCDEFGSVAEAMKIFFELHQKRWTSKGMSGVYELQETRNRFIEVAESFADNGWLSLYFLTVNDKPIAGIFGCEYNQKMYSGLSGFDPAYSNYRVGSLVRIKSIEKCIEKKIKEYDLTKGAELYKFDFAKQYRRNFNVRLVNKKCGSQLLHYGLKTIRQTKMDQFLGRSLKF